MFRAKFAVELDYTAVENLLLESFKIKRSIRGDRFATADELEAMASDPFAHLEPEILSVFVPPFCTIDGIYVSHNKSKPYVAVYFVFEAEDESYYESLKNESWVVSSSEKL